MRLATFSLYFVLIILLLNVLFSAPTGVRAQQTRIPTVLVDLSHEFTFAFDAWLPVGYLNEPNSYVVRHDFATLDANILSAYDVIVIEQSTTNLTFTQTQLSAIIAFVQNGGGLFLVGRGANWLSYYPSNAISDYPLNNVANRFGFQFTGENALPNFVVNPDSRTVGVSAYQSISLPGTLQILNNTDINVLVADSQHRPIIISKNLGKGEVIAVADEGCVSTPWPGPMINPTLIANIFASLAARMIGTGPLPSYRIYPEKAVTLENITVYYPDELGFRVPFVLNVTPRIFNNLENLFQGNPRSNLDILLIATSGGGFSAPGFVGVGALFADFDFVSVLAHEMTTSFMNPPPEPGYMEAWNILSGLRVSAMMGYTAEVSSRYQYFNDTLDSYDPTHKTIDLAAFNSSVNNQPYFAKVIWLTSDLEKKYNVNLMAWYVKYKQGYTSLDPGKVLSTDDEILFFSLACGTNLYAYFGQLGTTIHPRPIVLLQSYRVTQNGASHIIFTESNSTIGNLTFADANQKKIMFNTEGREGTIGFCNITLPKEFLNSSDQKWLVMIDNTIIEPLVTWNDTHTFLYFTYAQSTHQIAIIPQSTPVVPEFTSLILMTFLSLLILTLVASLKKLKHS